MNKYKVYLIGSIQDAKDGGVDWRAKIAKDLIELGFEVIDPTQSEVNHSLAPTIEEQKKRLENLKRAGEWELWDKVMADIRQSDLIAVNASKFVIVFYDPAKRLGGTIHEIVEAWQKSIPVYTISYQPKTEFNDWVLSLLRSNFKVGGQIFPNVKQCIDYIVEQYKDYIKTVKENTK